MSIRIKLLILLLAIALVPLVVVTWQASRTTRDLGVALAERNRTVLEERLTRELRLTIEQQAVLLREQKALVELAVRSLAWETARRLDAAPEPAPPLIAAERFDGRGPKPPGVEPSTRHRTAGRDSSPAAKPISEEAASVVLAPDVDRASVAGDLARLAGLMPVLQSIFTADPEVVFWTYVGLESGVHVSFPGHGGYPADYDPRRRPWYKEARDAGEPVWIPPTADASTGQILLTHAAPVRTAEGTMAGVAAVDVQILRLLEDNAGLPLAEESETLLVRLSTPEGGDEPGLLIVAQRDYDRPHLEGA